MKYMCKIVLSVGTLWNTLLADQYGEKYVIGHWSGGMGVCLHSLFNHLTYCEATGKTPVIFWGADSLYWTSKGFNGATNSWEYYFSPASNLEYKKGDVIHYYCEGNQCGSFGYYKTTQEKREQAHQLIKKYIKPNQHVQAKIDQFYRNYFENKRTIGIHIRGTDKVAEEPPVAPYRAVEEALKYADHATQFFIATDEEKILNEMLRLLSGRMVLYYNCQRSRDGNPLHCTYYGRSQNEVAQNGEDVVVEMFLMSFCDLLIHSSSSVSAIPLYLNPNLSHINLK